MAYLCGIDIGGTFTDCAIVDDGGRIVVAKAPSTPGDFSEGVVNALQAGARQLDIPLSDLLAQTAALAHGTTVGTNTMVQRTGAKVGLITTRGHADVIHIMRGASGRVSGVPLEKILHFAESNKPDPIVPKPLIAEVTERVDYKGAVVVPLSLAEAEEGIKRLLGDGVAAIAICFLWSFKNPAHEQQVRRLVEEMAPHVFVTCSSDLVPKWGEYERTAAVAINSYIGPTASRYILSLEQKVQDLGYRRPLLIMQCGGGVMPAQDAAQAPLLTLDSGPVGGLIATKYLAEAMGCPNVIATDMGGTSFDVGLIHNGLPISSYLSVANQYRYFVPRIDIKSVGSGGGSMVWIDESSGTLRVGPRSAGAEPGPACYGRGGTEPTVTDADLLLGYLDPDYFLGGEIKLEKEAAAKAIGKVAAALNLDLIQAASGVAKIVEFQMADLVRKVTIQKGYDPRDFVLFAYGGAGPVHAAVYGRELGVQSLVIPLGDICSVWSALGAASSDVLHIFEQVDILDAPFDLRRVNANFAALEEKGLSLLRREEVPAGQVQLIRSVDMRYRAQIHQVEVMVPEGQLGPSELVELIDRFEARYELLYGKGSGYRGAGVQIESFRCRAVGRMPKPVIAEAPVAAPTPVAAAVGVARDVYWAELGRWQHTAVYWGVHLRPGNVIAGPAIVQAADTTIVIHPDQEAKVDKFGNFVIRL